MIKEIILVDDFSDDRKYRKMLHKSVSDSFRKMYVVHLNLFPDVINDVY